MPKTKSLITVLINTGYYFLLQREMTRVSHFFVQISQNSKYETTLS